MCESVCVRVCVSVCVCVCLCMKINAFCFFMVLVDYNNPD